MWSTISRLFVAKPRSSTKTLDPDRESSSSLDYYQHNSINSLSQAQADLAVHVFESMDRNMGDDRRRNSEQLLSTTDAYETRQVSTYRIIKTHCSFIINHIYYVTKNKMARRRMYIISCGSKVIFLYDLDSMRRRRRQ